MKANYQNETKEPINIDKLHQETGERRIRAEFRERFNYWEVTRGAYIMSKEYLTELETYLFTGKAEGLCDIEEIKRGRKDEI